MMKKYYILSKTATVESYQGIFNNFGLIDTEIVSYVRAVNHVFVDNIISDKDSLILLIPTILDPFNAYSYDGVEYALKYYCHFVSIKKGDFQIILLGTEEESSFWKHCEYSSFLKCPHVSYLKNNVYPLKEYLAHIEAVVFDMDWTCCIDRLKQVNVKKPASYKTHHSITNEWSIYRWSKCLGITNVEIQKEIEDFLYFNYLKAIYSETGTEHSELLYLFEKGKILLIDDEVGKGWHSFFKSFCGRGPSFSSIGDSFKNLTPEEIINNAEQKVKEYNPDVVVLDLRLHDDDFEIKDPMQLTGSKIFERIKAYNKGIQIVVFSASNKVWNYLPLASDGVILKESPDLSVNENYTQECIKNLRDTLMNCLKKSYLRKIYPKIEKLKKLVKQSDYFGDETDVMLGNIDVAFDLLAKSEEANEYKAYSFLQLFLVIEKYVGLESVFDKTDTSVYLYNGSNRYLILKDGEQKENSKDTYYQSVVTFEPPYFIFKRGSYNARFIETFFKVSVLLIFKFGKSSSNELNWPILNKKRNDIAHSGAEIKDKDIECLLDFMFFIFDESNTCWRDIKDAFPVESLEEQIIKLPE